MSRLEGDPLKGIAQTGYSALFPPPWNISSETTDLAGSKQAGIRFVQMHTHTYTHTHTHTHTHTLTEDKPQCELNTSMQLHKGTIAGPHVS